MFMPAVTLASGHQVAAYEPPFRRICPLGALNVSRREEVKPDPEIVSIANSSWRPDRLDVARMPVACAENTSRRAALPVDLAPAPQSRSVIVRAAAEAIGSNAAEQSLMVLIRMVADASRTQSPVKPANR